MSGPIPAYLTGALALNTAGASPEAMQVLETVRAELTLRRRLHPTGTEQLPFWFQQGEWLYIPRGYALTDANWLLPWLSTKDGRSDGRPLPQWTRLQGITLGAPPHPPGQPAFVQALASGSRNSGIGGVGLAPTRSGKTLCAVSAAIELGRYTLILVDSITLMRQWRDTIESNVVFADGRPMRVGEIRAERFEVDAPFAVATIQTLSRRKLDSDVRRTYGTILIDECQSAPCDTIWTSLLRLDSQHVIGLTATPRRSDGLGKAIGWLCGPTIAELKREIQADVMFLRWPYRRAFAKITRARPDGSTYQGSPRITSFGRINRVNAAKAMFADPEFCPWLAGHIAQGVRDGRRVLVLVELKQNVTDLVKACRALGLSPGVFMGTMDEKAEKAAMQRNPCIATVRKAGRGVDFQPAPTELVLAAPVSDPEQIIGRGLQPQAEHKPLLVDVVVGAKALVKQAHTRLGHYRRRGFDVRNEPWVGEAA